MATQASEKQGLLVTVDASNRPEVQCGGRNLWPEDSAGAGPHFEFLCTPGETLGTIELTGRGKMNFCGGGGEPKPPTNAFIRVAKTELVDLWDETAESTFEVRSDETLYFYVESPRLARVELLDSSLVALSAGGGNHYSLAFARPTGSSEPVKRETVRVRAHIMGPCRGPCEKPADAKLEIKKSEY